MPSNFISCPYPVGYYYKRSESGELVRHPKGCGRWSCPFCGERKKKKLLDRLASYYSAHASEARLLTLTLRTTHDDRELPIMECWNRLRASLLKHHIKLVYFWMKEFTKKGTRHLHIMINRFIPKALLEKLWLLATGDSWKVGISRTRLRSPAGYMMKYVTKDVQKEHRFKRRERRYGFSEDFKVEKMLPTGEWSFQLDRMSYQAGKVATIRKGMVALADVTDTILHGPPPWELAALARSMKLYQEIHL